MLTKVIFTAVVATSVQAGILDGLKDKSESVGKYVEAATNLANNENVVINPNLQRIKPAIGSLQHIKPTIGSYTKYPTVERVDHVSEHPTIDPIIERADHV